MRAITRDKPILKMKRNKDKRKAIYMKDNI